MGTLDRVISMKKEGLSEGEIITRLKNEGISPMEINDALNQTKIKEAVGDTDTSTDGMTPSIMGNEEEEEESQNNSQPPQDVYTPQEAAPQEYTPQMPMESYGTDAPPADEYYDQGGYDQGGYGNDYLSSDTMIEIAEQVFSEKIKNFEKQMKDLNEFKKVYGTKIDDMNERLKRMEKYFDKLQLEILEKIGGFGRRIDSLDKEMDMVEDSITKISKKR